MATRKVNSVWRLAAAWAIAGAAALMVGGCDAPLSRATTADGETVDTVAVNPDDDAEITAVAALKDAHAKYDNALSVLRAYYEKTGALDEQTWAGRELENLKDAQAFSFEGVAVVTEPPTQSLDDANEPALVEAVVKARKNWQRAVATLGEDAVQVFGPGDMKVSKVGVGCGCATNPPTFQAMGCDVAIVTDDGTAYWRQLQQCEDEGYPFIRVHHGTSEEPGMVALTDYCNANIPGIKADYLPHRAMYRTVSA